MISLPSGYKKVEYIESTGTQYIDTGVYPSGNSFRVVMKFRYLVSHASLSLFGNSSSRPYSITIYSTYPVFYVGDRTAFANGPQTTLDTDYELDVTASNGTLTAIWNGEEHVDTYTGSLYTGRPVFVFGANGGGFLAESDKGYRLYYFQIYNDGVLVRDLLPCINPNGEIGMYDTVEGVFYPNAGRGEFVAGAVIIDSDNPASIDFSTLQGLTIPEGVVTQIADASGRVLWSAVKKAKVALYFSTYINSDSFASDFVGMAYVDIDGVRYTDDGSSDNIKVVEVNVPIGTVITLTATGGVNYLYHDPLSTGDTGYYTTDGYSGGGISVNREWVCPDGINDSTSVYTYTINDDTQIAINNYYDDFPDDYDNAVINRYGSIKLKDKTVASRKSVLQVEKIISDTYAAETTYTGEQFILLDIYPDTFGTVQVTYGGLTKTVTDTSGEYSPNAQQIFFGTFNGVSDSVTTPTSGELTIEGDCLAFACCSFNDAKASSTFCNCVTAINDFGDTTFIPEYAFCDSLITSYCDKIGRVTIPESITFIGDYALYNCVTSVVMLSTTPPKLGEIEGYPRPFGQPSNVDIIITVPHGYGAVYKAENSWRHYVSCIVEAS